VHRLDRMRGGDGEAVRHERHCAVVRAGSPPDAAADRCLRPRATGAASSASAVARKAAVSSSSRSRTWIGLSPPCRSGLPSWPAANPPGVGARRPGRPSTRTIDRRWGWQKLVAEAGGRPLDQVQEAERQERQRQLLVAIRASEAELGRWPTAGEWERATPARASRPT
jgi:hypothetical protein